LPGLPERLAVPSPLSVNFTPPGSLPVSVMVGIGFPVVVIVKEDAKDCGKVAAGALVNMGAVAAATDAVPPIAMRPVRTIIAKSLKG
jgi:hypothetical protein